MTHFPFSPEELREMRKISSRQPRQ